MDSLLLTGGRLTGALGLLLMLVAVAARLTGSYWLGGFQVGTLLLGGTAATVVGCFVMLLALTARGSR